ncbi:MAG: glutamate racemase [Gammaproteobacteria bacterium]|nr:MAG: glutamate racemase [Gammaproteobacteria bacterium]
MSAQPIGVFDSGVGGLSVLRKLQRQLPDEHFIYVADSAYAPYGQLSETTLKQRCQYISDFFVQQGVKSIVIACNTATAAMADWMRQRLAIPVVAIEPAIKPACQQTNNHRIGVFATQNTLSSERYQKLLRVYAANCTVIESPCIGFVEQVEKGDLTSAETKHIVQKNLQPMLENTIDTLVLGCTHYPFLKPMIRAVSKTLAYPDLCILDTADAVAKQLSNVLQQNQLMAASSGQPSHHYYTTACAEVYRPVFSKLMGKNIQITVLSNLPNK